jgi:hypothetical protein
MTLLVDVYVWWLMYRDTKWSNSIPIFPVGCIECIFDSVNRCGGGPVNLKVLMLLYNYPIHYTMSTEEIKQKKEKKVKVDTEGEVVGAEGVKKEKKDKKRKDREEEEVKPAEVSSSGEIIGETKEQRKARKKAKKEVRFNSLLGDSTDEIGKES